VSRGLATDRFVCCDRGMSDGPGILLDVFWVSRRLYLFDQLSRQGRRPVPAGRLRPAPVPHHGEKERSNVCD
jgi:hypothetical protein